MKFSIIALLVLLFLFSGQWVQAQRFKAGLSAGFNMAQIDGDDLAGFNKLGLAGGIRASAILSDRWQLGMELLFSQQGSARSTKDPLGAPYNSIRLNAVEAPVMILFSEWKLQLATGLSYSRLINHRIKDIGGTDVSDNLLVDSGSLNFLLGGTYFFQPNWGLDVRWTRGLMARDVRSELAGGQVDQFLSYFLTIRALHLFN